MRKSWDDYFFDMAEAAATRSTCQRAHHGCIIVQGKVIISTGYNGSLPGEPHCEDVGCKMQNGHCTRTLHAEANAVAQAAKTGARTEGASAYVTGTPCFRCEMLLKASGVSEIKWNEHYDNQEKNDLRI